MDTPGTNDSKAHVSVKSFINTHAQEIQEAIMADLS